MKIARFMFGSEEIWGVISGDNIHAISGTPYDIKNVGRKICSLSETTPLAPLTLTNKVPAIAANYGERDDRDGPGIFMKQPGTYVPHQGNIVYPRSCKSVPRSWEMCHGNGEVEGCRQTQRSVYGTFTSKRSAKPLLM